MAQNLLDILRDAAAFMVRYNGQKGTEKQIARYIANHKGIESAIIRNAQARGWKAAD